LQLKGKVALDPDIELKTGDRVRLVALPAYFKTAEPMPMLRPPNVVALNEEGVILGREPADAWRVRFKQGAYLVDQKYLAPITGSQLPSDATASPAVPEG
jgi:Protein of unknown function (DUF3148)